MASQYERELRGVLAGIPKSVEAIIRSCEDLEKNRMRLVIERPFLVVRAAGSGMEGSGDLLALRETFVFQLKSNQRRMVNCISLEELRNNMNQWCTKEKDVDLCHSMPID